MRCILKRLSIVLAVFLPLLITSCGGNQLSVLKNGKSDYEIIIPKNPDLEERHAAEVFKRVFLEVSGQELEIKRGNRSSKSIIIEKSSGQKENSNKNLQEDGFQILTDNSTVEIIGGTEKGVIYGVYSFFEKFADCRWLSNEAISIPKQKDLILPKIKITEVPLITFREDYYSHSMDSVYRDAHKLDPHAREWGKFVHTFFSFLSPEDYFEEHPEYFAEVNGKRTPHTQLCLSNPEVSEIVSRVLGENIKDNPNAKYWSVSQMDTYGFCTCENCKKIDEEEGSPSGTMIRFVNKLAEQYPDKIISTLAYQFSRKPPLKTVPRENVNIMFCSIELNRSQPIGTDSTSASFREEMEGWSKLTDNIIIWDYVIQFSNLFAPFPNLHVLQPNLQYFVENNAKAHFQQGNREIGGDMNELRSYLIAKLLWNPDVNLDSVKQDFLSHYYGAAAPHINEYINLIHENLIKSGFNLDIFGNPAHHSAGFLTVENIEIYDNLFDKAEKAVEKEPEFLKRVQGTRLGLMFAKLEIGKRHMIGDHGIFSRIDDRWEIKPGVVEMLETFTKRANERSIHRLMEWHTNPDDYYQQYPRELDASVQTNLAQGSLVKYETSPNPKFLSTGDNALIDGLQAGFDLNSFWQGWETDDMEVVIDLREIKDVSKIKARFLHSPGSWIFVPKEVTLEVSKDGSSYKSIYKQKEKDNQIMDMKVSIREHSTTMANQKVRYIRVKAKNVVKCPTTNCLGGASWVFCDEIVVQ